MQFKTKCFFSIIIVFVFFLNGSLSAPLSDQKIINLYKMYTPGYNGEQKTVLSFVASLSEKAWMGRAWWRKDWPGEAFNGSYSDKDYADTVRYILITGGPFGMRKSATNSQEKEELIHALKLATDVLYREKKDLERKDFFFSTPIPLFLSSHQEQVLDLANSHFQKLLHPKTALDNFRVEANNNPKKYLGLDPSEGRVSNNPRAYFTREQIVYNRDSSLQTWDEGIYHIYYMLWVISQAQNVGYIEKNFPDVIAILKEEGKNHFDLSFTTFIPDRPYPISVPKINRQVTSEKDEILFGAVHSGAQKVNIYNENVYTVNIDSTQDIDLIADMSNALHLQGIPNGSFSKIYVEFVPPTAYYNQYFFKNASRILKLDGELIIPVSNMDKPPFNINDFRAYFARYKFNITGKKNCNFPRKKEFENKNEGECWILQKHREIQ